MKHLLSLEALPAADIAEILTLAKTLKATRGRHAEHPLKNQCWGLIFSKSSTRTRVSFEVGIRELGGDALFLSAHDIQLGRGEPIKDTARVMGRMLHGAIIRTFAQQDVEDFAHYGNIPTINALTDAEHPCQILADLFTIQEKLGTYQGKTVTFIGDGACNVPISWIWAASKLDFQLRIAAPKPFQPAPELIARAGGDIVVTDDIESAVVGSDVLYSDVWVSMGMEKETEYRLAQLAGYQINSAFLKKAAPGALAMHCLPAYRGKEITDEVMESHADTIFTQAENRLHVQKAILCWLVK
ncbi:MAG: ornithine carbamoyltransferase [Chthoniobacteraceae bacterium]|nr:ornithine carbamoyltransferase [Chthoniobacteraceae bacterium]